MFDKPRWQNARDRGGGQDDQRKRNGIEHSIQDGQGKLENPYKQESDRVRVGIGQCGTVIEPFGKECAFGLLFKLDIGRIFKTVDLFSLQLVQAFFPVCFPGYKILIETDAAYEHHPNSGYNIVSDFIQLSFLEAFDHCLISEGQNELHRNIKKGADGHP